MLGLVGLKVGSQCPQPWAMFLKGMVAQALGRGMAALTPGSARGLLSSQRNPPPTTS